MREFLTQYLTAAVETFQLDTFRTDFNIGPLPNWRVTDAARCPLPPTITGRSCPNFTLAPGFDVPPTSTGLSSSLCAFKTVASSVNALPEVCARACCNRTDCTAFLSSDNGVPGGLPDRAWSASPVCPGESACLTESNTSGCCFLHGGVVSFANHTPGGRPLPPGLVAGSATSRVAGTPAPPNARPTWSTCDGLTENRYIAGLYRMWDDVRHAQPHLVIDNCAGGGNRIDLETLSRSVYLWRTDEDEGSPPNVGNLRDPILQQADTMGLTMFAPVNSGNLAAVKDLPNGTGDVNNTVLDPYLWRGLSTTSGGFASNERLWNWILAEPSRVQKLRDAVTERQDLRRYALGDFWILSPTLGGAPVDLISPTQWAVWQLHDAVSGAGAVTLFRRSKSTEVAFVLSGLRGLPGEAEGTLTSTALMFNVSFAFGFTIERHQVMSRTELTTLRVELPRQNSSAVVRYTPVGRGIMHKQ